MLSKMANCCEDTGDGSFFLTYFGRNQSESETISSRYAKLSQTAAVCIFIKPKCKGYQSFSCNSSDGEYLYFS